jgi:DDE domain
MGDRFDVCIVCANGVPVPREVLAVAVRWPAAGPTYDRRAGLDPAGCRRSTELVQARATARTGSEVVTEAPVYPRVLDELVPVAQQYANNPLEADHGRLKARLRPMRGLKRLASARTISAGHAFVHNLRRGHYAITTDVPLLDRLSPDAPARIRVSAVDLVFG